jgi:hypothetical protein
VSLPSSEGNSVIALTSAAELPLVATILEAKTVLRQIVTDRFWFVLLGHHALYPARQVDIPHS